jgi:HAD superfamily hydrolase (TIGR01509 family)
MLDLTTPIRAVLLDLDGTCFDTEGEAANVFKREAASRGLSVTDQTLAGLVGLSTHDTKIVLVEQLGDQAKVDELTAACFKEMLKRLKDGACQSKPGLDGLLKFLKVNRIPCAIASSSDRLWVESVLGDRLKEIQAVVTAADVAKGKPEPDVFLEAARQLGVPAPECLVVEDSLHGIRAAKQAGMQCAYIPDHPPPSQEAGELADLVLPSLASIQGILKASQDFCR